jgi:hypothetical protein
VLRPEGLALLSANGPSALEIDVARPEWDTARKSLAESGFYFSCYQEKSVRHWKASDLPSDIDRRYGCTIQTVAHIQRRWGSVFEVLEFKEGAFRGHQSLVALRRGPTTSN